MSRVALAITSCALIGLYASCGDAGPTAPIAPGEGPGDVAGSGGSAGSSSADAGTGGGEQGGAPGSAGASSGSAGTSGGSAGAPPVLPDAGASCPTQVTVFRDADGDGRHGETALICSDAALPAGFSRDSLGADSSDDDPRRWSELERSCKDADGDGHFVDCDGYPEGEDCNDAVGFIHPGAIETVGTDFDCDPATNVIVDETHGVFASSTGNDNNPCGTRAAPCRSLRRAEELLAAEPAGSQRRYLFAAGGPYTEAPLTLRHSLIGGFAVSGVSGTTWTRSFSARQLDLNGLSWIDSSAADGPRFTTQGDGLVFDGLYVTGPRLGTPADCTGWSMQGPAGGSAAAAAPHGNLLIHSFVYQRCGEDGANVTALTSGHPVFVVRSTLHIEDDADSPPLNVHGVDLYPAGDSWFEDSGVIVSQRSYNRQGIRFVPQAAGATLHLRSSDVELQGNSQFNETAYGVHAFDSQVMAESLRVLDQDISFGVSFGLVVSRTSDAPVRADVVRSYLSVRHSALAIDGGDARVVQSFLDSSDGETGAVHAASGSRLLLLNSVVRSDSTTPIAVLAAPGATEVAAVNSIFDVPRGDRPVTGIKTTDTPLRLVTNAFSLDANTAPGECPVDVANHHCADFSLNDCSSWGGPCAESSGNLIATISFAAGGSPGGTFEALHLPSVSSCIDTGTNLNASEILPYGNLWLQTDVDGDPRPSAGWDIGLDERL